MVQSQYHREFTDSLKRAFWQADFIFDHFKSLLNQRIGNIRTGDRAEQTAIHTGFLAHGHAATFQLGSTSLRFGQLFSSHTLQLGLLHCERIHIGLRGTTRTAGRDQKVAGVAVFHFNHVTQFAQVDDCVHQYNLHGRLLNAGRCKA